jgi:hypothetical protein
MNMLLSAIRAEKYTEDAQPASDAEAAAVQAEQSAYDEARKAAAEPVKSSPLLEWVEAVGLSTKR